MTKRDEQPIHRVAAVAAGPAILNLRRHWQNCSLPTSTVLVYWECSPLRTCS
jgi:hypothetical protein